MVTKFFGHLVTYLSICTSVDTVPDYKLSNSNHGYQPIDCRSMYNDQVMATNNTL